MPEIQREREAAVSIRRGPRCPVRAAESPARLEKVCGGEDRIHAQVVCVFFFEESVNTFD